MIRVPVPAIQPTGSDAVSVTAPEALPPVLIVPDRAIDPPLSTTVGAPTDPASVSRPVLLRLTVAPAVTAAPAFTVIPGPPLIRTEPALAVRLPRVPIVFEVFRKLMEPDPDVPVSVVTFVSA